MTLKTTTKYEVYRFKIKVIWDEQIFPFFAIQPDLYTWQIMTDNESIV